MGVLVGLWILTLVALIGAAFKFDVWFGVFVVMTLSFLMVTEALAEKLNRVDGEDKGLRLVSKEDVR